MMRRFLFVGGVVLPALLSAFVACGDDADAAGANGDPNAVPDGSQPLGDPPPPVSLATCDNANATPDETSGYIFITKARLESAKKEAASGSARFKKLKAITDRFLGQNEGAKSSIRNEALMYLLTGEKKYADSAYAWTLVSPQRDVQEQDGNSDGNYLYIGDRVGDAALVLNWAKAALSDAQQKDLADFMNASIDELWFHTKGTKWAISDTEFPAAGNNFRMAFIEATAYAGYALKQHGDARGQKWIDLAIQKLEMKGGVFQYIQERQLGGDWLEGTNYGQRSKQRLNRALATIASMGGKNYFNEKPFFANSVQFAIHQAQPGAKVLYPGGDLARTATAEVSAFDHEYMQIATYWLCDGPARRLGQHYVTKIADTYEDSKRSFDYTQALYFDFLYTLDIPADLPQDKLQLSYKAEASNWINARSGWDEHATSYSVSGSPVIEQSHQHFDTGSFLLYKDGWLMVTPENFGGIGGPMEMTDPGARQGLQVTGFMPRYEGPTVPGMMKHVDRQAAVYTQIDNTLLYRYRRDNEDSAAKFFMNEHTRELVYLRPDTVFVFDRVDAKGNLEGKDYNLNFHFPKQPQQSGNRFTSGHDKAGIQLVKLLPSGGTVNIVSDDNDGSYRIEEPKSDLKTQYLNVVQVGATNAPAISPVLVDGGDKVAGAFWNATVVVFSKSPKGAPQALPFSYTVANAASAQHLITNLEPNSNITLTRSGDTYTVSKDGPTKVDAAGVAGVKL